MKITLYGVRGSIATPGKDTVRYGGNTPCVFVELEDGHQLIFDGGTGARALGEKVADQPGDLYCFFSHFHWDHIQGVPFFRPAYQKNRQIHLIANHAGQDAPLSVLNQMIDPHFPIPRDSLNANVDSLSFDQNRQLRIGEASISSCPLNHPGGGSAYRIDTTDGSLAYITDNELFPPTEPVTRYEQWLEFIAGVDLLIHDAMYLDEELPQIHGWGHSLISQTMQLGADADIPHLVLFHHDPARTDDQLDEILKQCREQLANTPHRQVHMAREGDCYHLKNASVSVS